MDGYGFISLVPIVVLIVIALITKDTIVSIIMGVVTGFVIMAFRSSNPKEIFGTALDTLYSVMTNADTAWVLLLCALFGSLIALMEASGGALGFSHLSEKLIKNRKASLIGTWVLGIIVFVDDYLNALAVGSAVRKLTDRYKVSREMIAYIINSTGVTVCAVIPFSTWSAFMSSQMDKAGMVAKGTSPIAAYISSLPFMIYGILAIICVPLFCLKILPLFGPMKKAEQRAIETGEILSPDSKAALVELPEAETKFEGMKCRAINFLLPILMVAVLTILTEDILIGLFAAIGLCLVMYLPQRLMSFRKFFDYIVRGMTDMFPVLVVIILSYTLQEVNSQLGLIDFAVNGALKALPAALLPVTIFVAIGLLSFASGSFWGLAAIAFPIVGSLSQAMGVSPSLCTGALVSAVAFGGHICIYSDTVILASASTQVTNYDYFKTSLPLVAVPFALSAIIFTVLGFVMT